MSFSLEPCPSCARHIKTTEVACPFCGADAAVEGRVLRARAFLTGRPLSRAALLFAGAAAVTACGKATKTVEPPDAAVPVAAPPYGVPAIPEDIPPLVAPANDGGPLDAGPVRHAPPYGVPNLRGKGGKPDLGF